MRQIVVSVDTEEEGLWGGTYSPTDNTTDNLKGLAHFQSVCEEHSVPPTYLIDAPVLDNHGAIEELAAWQDSGRCEVGAHCHPWCNPPLQTDDFSKKETYLCNLPGVIQHEKLTWLTERIRDATGKTPTSYRAGRYGFDASTAEVLEKLGYIVDSSVLPVHDYRSRGGPDFRWANRAPSRFFGESDERRLIEIPVTTGFTGAGFVWRRGVWCGMRRKPWSRLRVAGLADRLGIARRVKLSPEGTQLADLQNLVDTCVREGLQTLVLMLHSSSLAVGFSPYSADSEKLESLYTRLTSIIQYATQTYEFQPVTLTQAAKNLFPTK